MRLIDADRLLDRCIFYHLPNGDLAVPIIDVQHAPTVEAPDINVGNMDTTTHDSIPAETGKNDGDRTSGDCISRRQAIDELNDEYHGTISDESMKIYQIIKWLNELPSAEPERKTGRWIPDGSELGIKCNKCGKSFSDYVNAGTGYMFLEETPNFCPNCGRNMEEGEQ